MHRDPDDGQEFRARHGRAVPILIVTAADHLARRCDGLDVAAVLPKPFEVAGLLGAARRHVRPPGHEHDGSRGV